MQQNDPRYGQEWSYQFLNGRDGTVGDDRYHNPPIRFSTDFDAALAAQIRGVQMIMDGEEYRNGRAFSSPNIFEYHVYSRSNRPADIFSSHEKIDAPGVIHHYTARRGYGPSSTISGRFIAPNGQVMDEQKWLRQTDPNRTHAIPEPEPREYGFDLFGWHISLTRKRKNV